MDDEALTDPATTQPTEEKKNGGGSAGGTDEDEDLSTKGLTNKEMDRQNMKKRRSI